MLEFKLEYYFEKYKDKCIISIPKFKEIFIKDEGNFTLLNELVVKIQRYQYKKYGEIVSDGKNTINILGSGIRNEIENRRKRNRFGTKEDRIKRKLEEKYK